MTDLSLPQAPEPSLKPPSFRSARTILALMLREMGSTYGSSPGGYAWAILQPVGMLLVLSFAFALVMRAPSLGTSFILFYATAFLPFHLYQEIEKKIRSALRYARSLLAYPAVTWMDAILARLLLNLVTGIAVFCIVITGILIFEAPQTILTPGPVMIGVALATLTGLGVGLLNAVLTGLFPVWSNIWSIVSRPLFLASGIFYTFSDLPQAAQAVLWWNPLIHVTGLVRSGFYPTYRPEYVSLTYGFGLALGMIALGMIFMRSQYTDVLER